MFVLKVLGVILGLYLLYEFIKLLNRVSDKKYNYKFFDEGSAFIVSIGYYFCYFGYSWYEDAVRVGGDILNGSILMGIGAIILLIMMYINIKSTNLFMGVVFGIFQFLVYIPVAVIAFYLVVVIIAALFQTKPVYVLNND